MRKAGVVTLTTIALTTGALIYYIADPLTSRWMPQCLIHKLTGFDCPGCGSQRMIHALLHGDFAAAWSHNAFLLLMIPLLAAMVWLELTRKRHPDAYRRIHSLWTIGAICAGMVIWTLYRNLS